MASLGFSRADGLGQEDLEKPLSPVTTASSRSVSEEDCGKLCGSAVVGGGGGETTALGASAQLQLARSLACQVN